MSKAFGGGRIVPLGKLPVLKSGAIIIICIPIKNIEWSVCGWVDDV